MINTMPNLIKVHYVYPDKYYTQSNSQVLAYMNPRESVKDQASQTESIGLGLDGELYLSPVAIIMIMHI